MNLKRFLLIGSVLLASSCNKESDVDPAAGTFIRYFGSENNNDAVLAIEGDDGYVLLSNVEIQQSTTDIDYKLKITKTDLNGQFLWEKNFPAFDDRSGVSMKGASVIHLPGTGYLVVGERIKSNATKLLVLQTDLEGNLTDSVSISGSDINDASQNYDNASLSGRAIIPVTENGLEAYVVLGQIVNSPNDMFVGKLTIDLSLGWNRKYHGNARNEVVNRLFSSGSELFWSATVGASSEQKDVRIVEAPMNSESTILADPPVVSPDINEIAKDFCKTLGGWAIVGSSNKGGDADIFLLRTSTNGTKLYERNNLAYNDETADPGVIDPINEGIEDPSLNDEGKSITTASDGNLLIVGTVETVENQQDVFVMKLNTINNKAMWRKMYGGGDRDEGASVRTTSDGSVLVFGTTYFGRSRKLMLMKLNSEGNL